MKYIFKDVSEEKMALAKRNIINNGGRISESAFSIQGVEGRYDYEDGKLVIIIDDKPWLASWGMIEDKLNSFFE